MIIVILNTNSGLFRYVVSHVLEINDGNYHSSYAPLSAKALLSRTAFFEWVCYFSKQINRVETL